ncbi:four helix bundle protein [Patescibacteria group bacterium]|nr:MAG: four helix bundle protein [Patescibacteria group bacterium]
MKIDYGVVDFRWDIYDALVADAVGMQLNYEKLDVVRMARLLCIDVYRRTKSWPGDERMLGGLGHQVRRASVSVCLNLAEGSAGTSADFARFVQISTKSLVEVRESLMLAAELGFQPYDDAIEETLTTLYFKLINLRRVLQTQPTRARQTKSEIQQTQSTNSP